MSAELLSGRSARMERTTSESSVVVELNLDGTGQSNIDTSVPFYDHMLTALSKHSLIDLTVKATGDLHIDAHHTVEDIGITLGQAFAKALGDKKGVRRYGHAYVPLDEALSRVALDLSGRPGLEFGVEFKRARIGDFDVDLVHEFFQGFVNHAGVTLHIDNLRGENAHHQAETVFKAFGRALRDALELDSRALGVIPSMQASHQTSDMYWAGTRLGVSRLNGAYAWRSFIDAGVIVPNGSDFPVEQVNPLISFHAAFTRQDADNWPPAGWYPDQRMTRAEALKSITLWPAFAAFQEKDMGSLTIGKFADFVVLDQDLMRVAPELILKTRVLSTWVGGKSVYEAK